MFRAAFRLARPAALVAIAAVAAACVGSAGAAGSTPSSKPVDPDKVIFRVSWEGGFVTPDMLLGRLPVVAVHADGRVITQGPVLAIYPGPFMPNLQERTLSEAGLERLIMLAREQDLLKDVHYGFPGIADATDTVLEINLDGESYRVSAYALAEAGFEGEIAPAIELEPAEVEGRAALREFIDALMTIPETDYVDQPHAYEFEALRLYVKPAEIIENSEFRASSRRSPGRSMTSRPRARRSTTRLSIAASSSKAPISRPSCRSCRARTSCPSSKSEGALYSLIPQPLYPAESGCP